MAFQGFDPSILLGASNPNFISQGIAGFQAGQQMGDKFRQRRTERQTREGLQQAAGMMEGLDPATQAALEADPELFKKYLTEKITSQMKIKTALPDNEWIDDPTNQDYQIYVEKVTDPETRLPVFRKITNEKGEPMRKKKNYVDRLAFEKDKLKQEQENFQTQFDEGKRRFTKENVLASSKNALEWKLYKMNKRERDVELARKKWELESQKTGAKIDYDKYKRDALDAVAVIDDMIGSADGAKPVHPGFKTSVGMKGGSLLFGIREKPFAGSEAANFMKLYNKINNKAFMEAFQALKGGGPITDVEGQKATEALIEMDTAQSEQEFIRAARKFQKYVVEGIGLAEKEKQGKMSSQRPSPQSSGTISEQRKNELRNKYNY